MLEAIILLTVTETDGILTVRQTDECAYHVTYENYLAGGSWLQEHSVDNATIIIQKGPGEKPETVTVTAWGQDYVGYVNDHETVVICVPWPLMG